MSRIGTSSRSTLLENTGWRALSFCLQFCTIAFTVLFAFSTLGENSLYCTSRLEEQLVMQDTRVILQLVCRRIDTNHCIEADTWVRGLADLSCRVPGECSIVVVTLVTSLSSDAVAGRRINY